MEAEPEAIRAFYRLFDQSVPMDQTALRSTAVPDAAGRRSWRFSRKWRRCGPLPRGWTAKGRPPGRVSILPSISASIRPASRPEQIIDWTLEVGEQTVHATDSQRQGRWRFGDRVRLTLRWAKDAPMQPSLAGTPPGDDVEYRLAPLRAQRETRPDL